MTTTTETKTFADELRGQLTNKYGLRFSGGRMTVDKLVEQIKKDGLAYTMTWSGQITDALKSELVEQARTYIETELVPQDDAELIRLLDVMVIHGSHYGVSSPMGIPQRPMDMMLELARQEVLAEAKQHLIQSAEFALAAMVRERFKDQEKRVSALKQELRELKKKYDRARSDTTKERLLDEIDTATMKYNVAAVTLKGMISAYVEDLSRHEKLPVVLNPDVALSYHLQQI